jgi:hypothetical protein
VDLAEGKEVLPNKPFVLEATITAAAPDVYHVQWILPEGAKLIEGSLEATLNITQASTIITNSITVEVADPQNYQIKTVVTRGVGAYREGSSALFNTRPEMVNKDLARQVGSVMESMRKTQETKNRPTARELGEDPVKAHPRTSVRLQQ